MKKDFPLISVIVPIYNVEKYLQQCIDSICKQTYFHLEIILVDDGSPDACGHICDENSKLDSRIVVIHQKNKGLSGARNAGLDVAKGKYISFIDSDDTIHPKFIEILFGLCEYYDADIAQCDYLMVAETSFKLPLNPIQSIHIYNNRQAIYELCCTTNSIKYTVSWNKLYKKELFKNIRYPVNRINEDEFTTYLLLWNSNKIVINNQYLYYYLQRSDSIMGQPFSIKRLDVLDALKGLLIFLKANSLNYEYFCVLKRLLDTIEEFYQLSVQNKSHNKISSLLLEQKESIIKIFDLKVTIDEEIEETCIYSKHAKIVLYGAGQWGNIYYQWIHKNNHGKIVGWVDNSWPKLKNKNIIMPIDSLLKIEYDYILIAIKNKLIQGEIFQNLISWGIDEKKIILIK